MATPLKRQFELDPETILKIGKCHNCGGPVEVKISKSQAAYYNCYNSNEKAQPCQGHHRWGGYDSRDLRRAYLVKTGAIQPTKMPMPKPDQAANLNRPPIKAVPDLDTNKRKQDANTGGDYGEYGL